MAKRCTGQTRKGERCRRRIAKDAESSWCGRCVGPTIGATADVSTHDADTWANNDPLEQPEASDDDPLADDIEVIDRHLHNPKAKVDAPNEWFKSCTKCEGTGNWSPKTDDKEGGVCSACNGSGRNFTKDGKVAYKAAKQQAAATARADALAAFRDDPEFTTAVANVLRDAERVSAETEGTPQHFPPRYVHESAYLKDLAHYPQFTHSIAFKAVESGRWSDKQRAALVKAVTAADEPKTEGPPAPSGKHTFAASIIKVERRDGWHGPQNKMLVESDAGWRAWMTCPAALTKEADYDFSDLKGLRVNLEATLEPSDDDPAFAFGKGPKVQPTEGWEGTPVKSQLVIAWAQDAGHDRATVEAAWDQASKVHGPVRDRATATRALITNHPADLARAGMRGDGTEMGYREQRRALAEAGVHANGKKMTASEQQDQLAEVAKMDARAKAKAEAKAAGNA